MAESLICQLAREPVPGRVKTRLLPVLSPESAAELHAAMVRQVCTVACQSGANCIDLWVDGDIDHPLFADCRRLGVREIRRQRGADLGLRMLHIAEQGFAEGFDKVVLVGSDAPSLTPHYLREALSRLDRHEVVFGPALDGGYVLLALRRSMPELFRDLPWGGDQVLSQSLARLEAQLVDVALLEPLPDIDRPEDLRFLPKGMLHTVDA